MIQSIILILRDIHHVGIIYHKQYKIGKGLVVLATLLAKGFVIEGLGSIVSRVINFTLEHLHTLANLTGI